MSDFMNNGISAVSGTWVFGTSFKKDGTGTLTKIKIDGEEQKRISSKFAKHILVVGGWIVIL